VGAVVKSPHLLQFAFTQGARDVAAEELPQSFEFQDFSACLQDRHFLEKRARQAGVGKLKHAPPLQHTSWWGML
jgi:hypothetical protein